MLRREILWIGGVSVLVLPASSLNAAVPFSVASDPSTWAFANNVASAGIDDFGGPYSYPANSGYQTLLSRTEIQSDVYRITSPQSFPTSGGNFNFLTNDLVFAYRLTLVAAGSSAVTSLSEIQVIGFPGLTGTDFLDDSLVLGQGFVTTSHLNDPVDANIDPAAADWEWTASDIDNLDNGETIVLLMFTRGSAIGVGQASLTANSGQPGVVTGLVNPPVSPSVYIPRVPTPGALVLTGIAFGVGAMSRRRR